MKRAVSILSVMLFLVCACATTHLDWKHMMPKGRAAMALSVYNNAYDSYLAEVKNPNLSEQSKEVLKEKKKALTAFHAALNVYLGYVQTGQVPPAQTDAALRKILMQFVIIR